MDDLQKELDMDNRDPNDLNKHVQVTLKRVIASTKKQKKKKLKDFFIKKYKQVLSVFFDDIFYLKKCVFCLKIKKKKGVN